VNKLFKLLGCLVILLPIVSLFNMQTVHALNLGYKDGIFSFDTVTKAASDSVKYKTLGFTVEFNGLKVKVRMPQIGDETVNGITTTYFAIPVVGKTGDEDEYTVMNRFREEHKDKDAYIVKAFSEGGITLHFYGIMTVIDSNYPAGGSIDEKGDRIDGEVYYTELDIKNARQWAKPSDLHQYFIRQCTIPAIPIPPGKLDAPIAKISRDGVVIDTTAYRAGEPVDISGALSWFPDYAENKYYKWEYKNRSSSTWTSLVDWPGSKSKDSPKFPALAEGQYDVRLTVKYDLSGVTYDKLTSSTTAVLNILQNTKDAYVTAEATASPSKIAFNGSDIPVKVTVKGTLSNFTDVSRIDHWTLYARKDGSPPELQSANTAAGLAGQAVFDFAIPAEKLDNQDSFTQTFICRATVYFKDGTGATDDAGCYTSVLRVKEMSPPVAILSCPSTVKAGSDVSISGAASYDKDGEIIAYYWETFGAEGTITGKFGTVCYMNEGTYTVQLGVEDNDGNGNVTSKQITVTPPAPTAVIKVSGRQKADRVVTIDSSGSSSPERFPLVPGKTRWTVKPVGSGATNDIHLVNSYDTEGAPWGVRYEASLLNGVVSKPVLFKSKGEYLVTLTVENTRGLTDTTTATIFINDDPPPVVDYSVYTTPRIYNADGTYNPYKNILFEKNVIDSKTSVIFRVLRENYNDCANRINEYFGSHAILPETTADFLSRNPDIAQVTAFTPLYAKLIITDKSYSPDGGYLQRRKVWVCYDADNNGSFSDPGDRVTLIQDLQGRAAIESSKIIEYLCPETVGRYKVEMEITEGWVE
jgi:hypothetical protein